MKKLTIAAGIMLCAAAMPAFAQDAAPSADQGAPSFTDAQLQGFAQAAVKIQIISQQARMQMVQAIDSIEGLDMDTYNRIVQEAQQNTGLSSQISQFMADYARDAGIPTTSEAEGGENQ